MAYSKQPKTNNRGKRFSQVCKGLKADALPVVWPTGKSQSHLTSTSFFFPPLPPVSHSSSAIFPHKVSKRLNDQKAAHLTLLKNSTNNNNNNNNNALRQHRNEKVDNFHFKWCTESFLALPSTKL